MAVSMWYWFGLFLAAVIGAFAPLEGPTVRYWRIGNAALWFFLFFLIGLSLYGSPIKR